MLSEGPVRTTAGARTAGFDEIRPLARALAELAGARVVLYVPADAASPALWITDAPGSGPARARLEDSARSFLTDPDAVGGDDRNVVFCPLRSAASEILGALVAAKDDLATWSDAERAFVDLALAFYGPALDAAAGAPLGSSAHDAEGPDGAEVPDDADVRAALDRHELVLVYQPEIDLVTREVVALEALLRWRHPTRGELAPAAFIPEAERSGSIRLIGAWVIDAAVHALREWREQLPGLDVLLRVNISPVQVGAGDLVEQFSDALETHGVPGRLVSVELTENAPLHDDADVAETLRRLKALGITSAIDDLATGYSTLSQLRALPVDTIKLDRSLIAGIDKDSRAQAIVTALIGLALNFNLHVVGEGVENEAEAATLLGLGCTRAQGHHLAKPLAADAVVKLLSERGYARR